MPERGGPTTQSGILFQNSVASLYLGRLCDDRERPTCDRILRLRMEAPGHVDDLVIHYSDGHTAYVQAKERIAIGEAPWRKLWSDFAAQYQAPSFIRGQDRLRFHVGDAAVEFHDLCELCMRARGSIDAPEWLLRLSAQQRALLESIEDTISTALSFDEISAHHLLAHTDVETWSLTHIERDLVPGWMPDTNIPSHTLFRLLRDRVGGEARVRGTFTADKLRSALLADDRVVFSKTSGINELRTSVFACGSLLRQHKATLGQSGIHVERLLTQEILSWTTEPHDDQRVGLLLDHAGRGKTVIMRDLLFALERAGVVTVALKADQQLSGVGSAAELENRLGLGEPVESAVARLAASGPVVVLIDQLDALSLSLARDQRAMNVILELISRLRLIPLVTVVVSCRTFDRHTDPRLKRIAVSREFPVPPFSDEEVAIVLASLDVLPDRLAPAAVQLLRTPLHLDLFASLVRNSCGSLHRLRGIASLQELYGVLWDEVVRAAIANGPSAADREAVLRVIVARMHSAQHVSVPVSVLDSLSSSAANKAGEWLTSAGILVSNTDTLSLLHQSFFDYCYARFFVGDGKNLLSTVLTSDQGLFIRPQILQVLAYLRGTGHPEYVPQLQGLLESDSLRVHLFELTIRWLGAQANPSDAEWTVMRRLIFNAARRGKALSAIAGSVAWFSRLREKPLRDLLRASDVEVDDLVVPYLASLVGDADTQEAVASLALAWMTLDEPWPQRAVRVCANIRSWHSPAAISLFESVLATKRSARSTELFQLIDLASEHPIAGMQIVQRILDQALVDYADSPAALRHVGRLSDHFASLDGYSMGAAIKTIAAAQPKLFLHSILPWLERALAAGPDHELAPAYYFNGDTLMEGWSVQSEIRDTLLESFRTALHDVASLDEVEFRNIVKRLEALPFVTPQELLAAAYRDLAPDYVEEAARFLTADPRRMRLGTEDSLLTRQVLSAVVVHLAPPRIADFERMILAHSGSVSRGHHRVESLRWRGIDQLHLLRAIPRGLLSESTRSRLQELERKFPDVKTFDHETRSRGGFVGSPIPEASALHMSDDAWLRAMAKYAYGVQHHDFLRGGAAQLAGILQSRVTSQPDRFAQLAMRLPANLDSHYSSAILSGLAASECSATLIYDVVREVALQAISEGRRSIGWALARAFERDVEVPADILDLLESWIREGPSDDEPSYESPKHDLAYAALNTARGIALGILLFALGKRNSDEATKRRWALLDFAAGDSSLALRSAALEGVRFMLDTDRDRAIGLFEQIVTGQPRLRSLNSFQEFIYYAKFRRFSTMEPFIRQMMEADIANTRQRGAELIVLSRLSRNGLEDAKAVVLAAKMAEDAISGSCEWRRGAARIYAHNLADFVGDECEVGLLRLMNDPSAEVRREVAWMVHTLRPEMAVSKQAFLQAFAASWAAQLVPQLFGEFLWDSCVLDPRWALRTIDALLNNDFPDDGRRVFGGASSLVSAVLRLYTDPATDSVFRRLVMDTFDVLIGRFSNEARDALSEWDRN